MPDLAAGRAYVGKMTFTAASGLLPAGICRLRPPGAERSRFGNTISIWTVRLYVSKRERPIEFTTAILGSWHLAKVYADGVIQSQELHEDHMSAGGLGSIFHCNPFISEPDDVQREVALRSGWLSSQPSTSRLAGRSAIDFVW